jgi:hypothetical protein
MTLDDASTALDLLPRQVLLLCHNPQSQFPRPTSDAYDFDAAEVSTFAETLAAVRANGWRLTDAALASANFTVWAAVRPGRFIGRGASSQLDFLE